MHSSQCDMILSHLKTGNGLTSLTALTKYNCLRLAARIQDLRSRGHNIVTMPLSTPSGKRVASYHLL